MDLTDILFSKPFIGNSGGGGGGSIVETATIEITVTDGTPTITSGAFPDWCTEANTNYIYGRASWEEGYPDEGGLIETAFLRIFSNEGTGLVIFVEPGNIYAVAPDLSLIARGTTTPTPLTGNWRITINLIYMPEDTGIPDTPTPPGPNIS